MFFRPDARSQSWAILRRGVSVTSERGDGDFVQITYEEVDRAPSPQFLTARITGWVARAALTKERRRHFFVLPFEGETPAAWAVSDGRDDCALFWAAIDHLPAIMPPQDQWIPYLAAATGGAPLLSAIMGKGRGLVPSRSFRRRPDPGRTKNIQHEGREGHEEHEGALCAQLITGCPLSD